MSEHHETAIVGAGFSGLAMAMRLKRDGREDFVILEKSDDLGGTWHDNSYPGCACDIPSLVYSLDDEQNPRWTRLFAGQQEIWEYLHDVAQRRGLLPHLRLRHEVSSAAWDDEGKRWRIETSQGSFTAENLISGAGALNEPFIPPIEGLDRFGGAMFHSARWDHDLDLTGRRVAVVGTGASAIQFMPHVQERAEQVYLFQRTPPWILPRQPIDIPVAWQERFARRPALQRFARNALFSVLEATHVGFSHPRLARGMQAVARRHIERHVTDPALRRKLTPSYRLGCKRILGSDTWYPTVAAPNVEVIASGLTRATKTGVAGEDGKIRKADTIIFGTGFRVTDPPVAHLVTGRRGATLAEEWNGSPQAHLGVTVTGFPNFFLLLGPGTGLGHNSVVLMIEAQVNYVAQALDFRAAQELASIEPRPEVQSDYIREVDAAMEGSVWTAGGCQSWYLDPTGRNSTLWPGTVRQYQRRVARFVPSENVLAMA